MLRRASEFPTCRAGVCSRFRLPPLAAAMGLSFVVSCGGGGGVDPAPSPAVLQVAIAAHDVDGRTLHYRWRASDGEVEDVDAATTTWRLPPGPGLHFVYVLVSNRAGGYLERRLVYSTDGSGTVPSSTQARYVSPPPSGEIQGNYFRGIVCVDGIDVDPTDSEGRDVYAPDVDVYMVSRATGFQTSIVATNLKGEYLVPDLKEGDYEVFASLQGSPFVLADEVTVRADSTMRTQTGSNSYFHPNDPGVSFVSGSVLLADLQPCGVTNAFFGAQAVPYVTLLDSGGAPLGTSIRVNAMGDYVLLFVPSATYVRVDCEDLTVTVPIPAQVNWRGQIDVPQVVFSDAHTPVIHAMTASIAGQRVGYSLPPASGLPSDLMGRSDAFLAHKGLDDRRSAAEYYVAIGAAASMDAAGNPVDAITFDDWKRAARMDPYAAGGGSEVTANYVNQVDLNLTRRHHSISHGPDDAAAYVCNHLGPTNESQAAVDAAVLDAVGGRNLVACVAMDYRVHPGTNGDRPYTRFFVFAPDGSLLSSVNLDGRGEKFVPGTCVACHGGDNYLGKFGADGRRLPDIGAHFLPYDTGNFAFADRVGLREADQAEAIFQLNRNVLDTRPTVAVKELVAGWYVGGSHVLDREYVPVSWVGLSPLEMSWYRSVYAADCRTCHVALPEKYNLDHAGNREFLPGALLFVTFGQAICGGVGAAGTADARSNFLRNHTMPNSLVTFNRFWTSAGSAIDLPSLTAEFWGVDDGCKLVPDPAR